MKKIALLFMVFFACQCVIASTGWNSQQTQEIRQKIASNNIYGPDSGRVTVRNYDRTKKMIESSMQGSANIEGSKAIAKASMKTPVNMSKVASTTMKRLARGGVAGMLGGAAVQALVDGVGWIIDSSDNVIKKPSTENVQGTISSQYSYYYNCIATELRACISEYSKKRSITNQFRITLQSIDNYKIVYQVDFYANGSSGPTVVQEIFHVKRDNPKIDYVPVSASELADKINEKNDSNTDSIVKSSYTPVDSSGKPAPDLSDVLNGLNDTIKDIVNDFKNVLNSDNPTSTGKTDSEPTIIYNNTVVNNNNTTTNTDGSTSITTGISELKIPPFCEYAMTMCEWFGLWKESDQVYKDHMIKTEEHQTEEKSFWESVKEWFDWTKEPVDDEPDSEQQEPDTQGIFDKTFDTAFSLSKQCPPDIPYSFETQYFSGSFNLNMNWLCIIFTALGYPLVFASHCIGMWILYQAVIQREIKW